jgi:hypothetical protein
MQILSEDTAEVALVMMDVRKIGQIFGNNELESNGTGRDFGKERANLVKSALLVIIQFLMIYLTIYLLLFESENDNNTSQEVMANDEHPEKEREYCKICHKSSIS